MLWKSLSLVGVLIAAGFGSGYWLGIRGEQLRQFDQATARQPKVVSDPHFLEGVEVGQLPGHLKLGPTVIDSLKVRVAAIRRPPATEPLTLAGSLFLDSSHLAIVHTRFTGEIVRLGEQPETISAGAQRLGHTETRQIRAGDVVKKGDILAVIWSKEIGEKKSDLVESLSRRKASKVTLERLEKLEPGSVAARVVLDARRQYESDVIAVERLERTLRSWKVPEAEIADVYSESERIGQGARAEGTALEMWANVEIRSPLDGIVLEQNVSLGEIVETGFDMFKIADVSRMGVLANVYEDDIPRLTSLAPNQRQWAVRLQAEPGTEPISGSFEVIGHVINPGQHTAAVVGWIKNSEQRLRAGQFITATVEVPGPVDAVLVPNPALIDQGSTVIVFVATDQDCHEVVAHSVTVKRRGRDFALVRRPSGDGNQDLDQLHEGQLVVISGNLELYGVLQDRPVSTAAN